MDDVVVIGVGMHPFGQHPGLALKDLGREAIWAAIHDAGIDPRAIGAGYVANCFNGFFTGQGDAIAPLVFRYAGLGGFPMIHVAGGGAAGTIAFHEAVLAVGSGQYETAIAVGVEKQYVPGDPARSIAAISTSGEMSVATELGLTWVGELAMSTRRMMARYGWTPEDFALVAEKNRRHGALNPLAKIQQPTTVAEILAARVVADPLTRPMCTGAAVDGAAAAIVCSRESARRYATGPLPRVAAMSLTGAAYVPPRERDALPGMLSMNEAPRAFAGAYERAGLGPTDLELVQVHDAVAPEELLAYQVIGLCDPGDEPKLLRSGATAIGGRVPFSTDGGLLSRGHPIAASGMAQIHETVVQMRGSARGRQVLVDGTRPPRVAAVQNAGAQGGPAGGGVAVSAALIFVTD